MLFIVLFTVDWKQSVSRGQGVGKQPGDVWLFNGYQFHIEHQSAERNNVGTRLSVPITKVWMDEKSELAANGHQLQSFRPAFDNHVQRKSSSLSSFDTAVENGPVDQLAFVVALHFIERSGLVAVSRSYHFVLEPTFQRCHPFPLAVFGQEIFPCQ